MAEPLPFNSPASQEVECAVHDDPVKLLVFWYWPPVHASQVSAVDEPVPRKFPALQEVECAAHDDPVKLLARWN